MNIFNIIKIVVLSALLSSCWNESYTEKQLTASNKNIQIYYYSQPQCEYKVMGYIDVGSYYYSKKALFKHMAEEAEKLDAEAVVIDYLERMDIKEYTALGKAISCQK